jgi:hypothetical protein
VAMRGSVQVALAQQRSTRASTGCRPSARRC